MDLNYIKRLGKTNLISSIIFLVLAVLMLIFCIWFTIEIATNHMFGIFDNQEENDVGMAFGAIFIVLIIVMADFSFGILTLIFALAGIPLLLSSISLLKMDKVANLDLVVKKLKRTRIAYIITIVVGSLILASGAISLFDFNYATGSWYTIFYVFAYVGFGIFLIIFSAIERKKVGKVIDEIEQPTRSINQI